MAAVVPGAATSRPRGLFLGEMRMHAAFDALLAIDPECEMSGEQAEAYIALHVNPGAVVAQRDAFADFLEFVSATAAAKRDVAAKLLRESQVLEEGARRMRESAIRTMTALEVDELRGEHRILKIKRSRGAVTIVDEMSVPESFKRVRGDDDLIAIRGLAHLVVDGIHAFTEEARIRIRDAAAEIRKQAEDRRRVVDKKAIQEAWRLAGGDTIPPVVEGAIAEPVVPGAAKHVDVDLVIK